ncbi:MULTISPECIES: substrate-binding domain-containing protein [unclassified Amycolatopsis]|uniref:substrate-binding domain-containing protein n=1 Tax=unclassified Amycolatopsis TaxID=2618356 RepID=UPI002876A561|nr:MULTISPECIES: substrate-binding domain-containing protein [unclassified Amycolatopsis]MDS0134568.1 substrate-binding domain-containing protein [Amycolatopsis sp. 505]MDS0147533.1 substrate-binding domain-containing protein [Amycolatopsis sp. CM201R]
MRRRPDPRGLTTIPQPMVRKGQLAAELLFDLLRGDPKPENVSLPTELVRRRTSGPPPPGRPLPAGNRRS